MTPDQARMLELLLWGLVALLGVSSLVLAAWRVDLNRTVGSARVVERPGRRSRLVYPALVLVAAGLLAFSGLDVPLVPSLAVLALGVTLALLAPGERDSVLGAQGVQQGWHARRFDQLEEWRLTGDHLRWRLFGEWIATHAPAALHAELRAQLAAQSPGRESRFQR